MLASKVVKESEGQEELGGDRNPGETKSKSVSGKASGENNKRVPSFKYGEIAATQGSKTETADHGMKAEA